MSKIIAKDAVRVCVMRSIKFITFLQLPNEEMINEVLMHFLLSINRLKKKIRRRKQIKNI